MTHRMTTITLVHAPRVNYHHDLRSACRLVHAIILNLSIFLDLLPGRKYTVLVSTATSFTDQLSNEMFSALSVSGEVTTTGSNARPGVIAKSFSSTEIAVAAIIPSLFALFLLLILIIVTIVFIYKQQVHKHIFNNTESRAYYSTVGPPSPQTLKIEENVAYEVVQRERAKSGDALQTDVEKNVAYGVRVH